LLKDCYGIKNGRSRKGKQKQPPPLTRQRLSFFSLQFIHNAVQTCKYAHVDARTHACMHTRTCLLSSSLLCRSLCSHCEVPSPLLLCVIFPFVLTVSLSFRLPPSALDSKDVFCCWTLRSFIP
jgi:hypothetical protein